MKRFCKPGDIILILFFLLAGAGTWFLTCRLNSKDKPSGIRITTPEQEYALSMKDTLVSVSGPAGETKIKIEDGSVWVAQASCPRKLCVRQGKISRTGRSIVCLPNRIVITIEGRTRIDATTY
ncbi:NusG domain II-containing protein [candidate division WOR-3 bacterium]|uniref:NusG domain II-containing protein n=1 Tax=candidate division WOR-3 bacterium TaxID=2052148 RepID=A0A9D5K7T1_UNCW3|nr:NusG domain II-containing protein [candidate division WOR-3 bacterium]MBD3363863.1 NusG domain II-containing protein [candidate division WOR-3 bacterium]